PQGKMQEKYEFPKRMKRVCVIGAGAAGLITTKNLRDEGLEVNVYERNAQLGGVWCYFDKPDVRSTFPQTSPFFDTLLEVPSILPAKTIHVSSKNSHDNKVPEEYATPLYKDLHTNFPHQLMSFVNSPFPENIPMFPNHAIVSKYLIDFAKDHALINLIEFQTSVERVRENESNDGWKVVLRHYEKKNDLESKIECYWREEEFDAVVVCNGHYNVPYVPEFEGLEEWSKQFPDTLYHSKYFREPNDFIDKTVLVVGSSASGTDISRIIARINKKSVYQSIRTPSMFSELNEKTSIIIKPTIKRFIIINDSSSKKGIIEFIDGSILSDVDVIIFATGYLYSFPFLRDLSYSPSVDGNSSNLPENKILLKNGKRVFNIYKQIFYIPNPTLSFVGLPYMVAPFPISQFQSLFIAKVLAEKVFLPSQDKMRQESKEEEESKILEIVKQDSKVSDELPYLMNPTKTVDITLIERLFHGLRTEEHQYINDLIEWINHDAIIGNTDENIVKIEKLPLWRVEMRRNLLSLRKEHLEHFRD
ncbi:5559_t:CDS:2, partial [Ambispora leptoticha]